MNEDILQSQSDDERVSPATQKTSLTKTNPSESNLRPNKSRKKHQYISIGLLTLQVLNYSRFAKQGLYMKLTIYAIFSAQPETIPRPTARVAVLNIDLKGYE